jgi:ABC-2 type transport system permease protein
MKILDIAFKDLTRSMRSMFTIGITVIAPLLITGLMYAAFSGMSGGDAKISVIHIGIVNLDTLPNDINLKKTLGDSIREMFTDESIKSWLIASDFKDEASVHTAVDQQEISVGVIIPPNFTSDFFANKSDTFIRLIQDPTQTIAPTIVRNMMTSLLDGFSGGRIAIETINSRHQALRITPNPTTVSALLENYQSWYIDFQRNLFHHPDQAVLYMSAPSMEVDKSGGLGSLIGMVMAGQLIFFAFYTGAYAMMSILREQEEGTLARLFTTPTDRTTVLAGKFLNVFITVLLQGLVLVIASHFAFGVDWGRPANTALILLGQVIAASGLGVLLIAFVKSTRQGGPVLGGALTGLGMLSGLFTVALPTPPAIFELFGYFTPQGWVLKGWSAVLSNQPLADVFLPFIVMTLLGVAMFAVGALLFRKRFA